MVTEEIIVRVTEKGVVKLRNLIGLQENLEKVKQGGGNVDKALARVNKRIDKATGGAKGVALQFKRFKFELLGVLFFGMAVNRFLTGLIKPALEVTGTFEALTFQLQEFFIPTGEYTVEIVETVGESMNKLPDSIKRIIGWIFIFIAFLTLLLFWFATVALGVRSMKTSFAKIISPFKTFGKWLLRLVFGVGLLAFFKKSWGKIMTKLVPILKGLGKTAGAFFKKFNPWVRLVFLLLLAFDLLKIGWKKLRAELEKPGKARAILGNLFNDWIEKINNLIDALNRIGFVNIPKINFVGNPVGESGPIDIRQPQSGAAPGGNTAGDSFFEITINTTNGIDEVSLKDELKNFINETNAQGVENIARR